MQAQETSSKDAARNPLPRPEVAHRPALEPVTGQTIALTVPKGTPIQVALEKEIRVENVGQPVQGRVIAPVYAFDRVVIPVGTTVSGNISNIMPVSKTKRTESALNADFTPSHRIEVTFTELTLPSGQRIAVRTSVTPGSGHVIQFVSSANSGDKPDRATEEVREAKQQIKLRWDSAVGEIKAPGKIHRLERYAIAQLPIHPQYIDARTVYFAELEDPLNFGNEPLTPQRATSITSGPKDGSTVEARLTATVSSAVAQKGDPVEAVITRPLFDGERLVLPQGSRLEGIVGQAQPAHIPGRNGKLLILFQRVQLPDGLDEKVVSTLAGVETDATGNIKLDSEGGAHANAAKTRYLTTAISLGLAGLSIRGDPDAKTPNPDGTTGNRIAGGAAGFKLIGMVAGGLVHSRALGYSMGAYGGGMSVYSNFIARGRDVVFPKNTAMLISLGTREQSPAEKPDQHPSKKTTK